MNKKKKRTQKAAFPLWKEAVIFVSPLRSGVFPLRRLGVVVDKVHAVVGVHAPLCGRQVCNAGKESWNGIERLGIFFYQTHLNFFFFFLEDRLVLPQPGGSGPRGSFSADIIDA